jgi:hypothetical protein
MSTRKTPAPQPSELPEIDPDAMEAVSGGCAACAQPQQQQQQPQGAGQLASLIPMLANQGR